MPHAKLRTIYKLLTVIAGSLMVAGCGGESKDKAKLADIERAIYTSALDCEAGGKLTLEQCTLAIETAIALHDKSETKYKSQDTCEEKEGVDKCERVDAKEFRPRFTAFVVTPEDAKTAKPLYQLVDGKPGFRSIDKETLLAKNENLVFSKSAVDASEPPKKKKK